MLEAEGSTSTAINLGTGSGTAVRELLASFERVYGAPVPTREEPPRPGDAVGSFANVDTAARLLGWRTQLGLDDGIASALEWGRRRDTVLSRA